MEKYYKCGRDQTLLDENIIQSLRINQSLNGLRKILGNQLFIEWLYISDFISYKNYQSIRVFALNPYKITGSCRNNSRAL